MKQINEIDDVKYSLLQKGALDWIGKNTTINRAKELLKEFNIKC